ncbi:MAG: type VI secretion system contractile sheath domain-containing protein, partial [Panacagrimonas sp.]
LKPRIAAAVSPVTPTSIDDFHPDALFAKLELFRALRTARTQPPPSASTTSTAAASDESPLSALLGGKPAGAAPSKPAGAAEGIEAMIRRVVAPFIVPDRLAETKSYVAAVDSAIADQMRQLLHDPVFQRVEAAWRGAQWLVSGLELDETLQLHVFDVSREELLADLAAAGGQVRQSGLYRALVDRWRNQPGAQGWSALVGLYRFGAADADIGLLAAMGIVAAQAGAPFLAEGDPVLADTDAAPAVLEGWNALRASEVGRWIGLVAPRMLLRRPYGARDEKIEAFAFEELGNTPVHEHYLWGSGALAAALLLGRAYRAAEGWSFDANADRGVDDLPSATRIASDGEKELVPSAEHFLADSKAEQWLGAGLMPLLSHRHLNAAQLMRFQSIALPAVPLAGLPD